MSPGDLQEVVAGILVIALITFTLVVSVINIAKIIREVNLYKKKRK